MAITEELYKVNKEFAWFLGYLLSDGCINKPKYRGKGDEIHLSFICKIDDKEVLYKVKEILQTKAVVHEYPNYKSPHAKLRSYDCKDIIKKYADIKTTIPPDIVGFERHFIRGLFDGDGCLYYRASRDSFVMNFVDEVKEITQWVANTITTNLLLPQKQAKYRVKDHLWEIAWEGNTARLIAWWLYHGDISHCSLKRKLEKYQQCVLNCLPSKNENINILRASKAFIDENDEIAFLVPSLQTLDWAKRLQHVLSFNTIPVFHNKGRRKYYHLYVPDKSSIADMRDILGRNAQVKA